LEEVQFGFSIEWSPVLGFEGAMANSQEGGPPSNSEAAATLQQLLDRQLSTTGRYDVPYGIM